MSSRKEEFPPEGKRVLVTPIDVVSTWRLYSKIPAAYAVATSAHESNFTINEIDTEPNGFISKGIFQISDEEVAQTLQSADILTLHGACSVLSALAEVRLKHIMTAAKLTTATADCYAYLALAHNQGLHAALKTIQAHGLDWKKYKERNPNIKGIASYGDDCISGGPHWPVLV